MKALSYKQKDIVLEDAKILYCLTHARYICSSSGQYKMLEKYKRGQFGLCPRTYCAKCPMLPIGISDHKDIDNVKLYCPKCKEIYNPINKKYELIDGAYFGTIFPHLFFMVMPEFKPKQSQKKYKPQIFGFNINNNWHQNCLEFKQDQMDDFMKYQEIEKNEAMILQQEKSGQVIIDIQQELDKNSKNVWNEMQNELKRVEMDKKDEYKGKLHTKTKMKNELDDDDKKMEIKLDSECKAFVGIDFGNCRTKIGYCLAFDDNIYILLETKTAILLD
eukprot:1040_1